MACLETANNTPTFDIQSKTHIYGHVIEDFATFWITSFGSAYWPRIYMGGLKGSSNTKLG